jgi:hypothetical protein
LGVFLLTPLEAFLLEATICLQHVAQVLVEIHDPEVIYLIKQSISDIFWTRTNNNRSEKQSYILSSRNHMKMGPYMAGKLMKFPTTFV